jgi:coproporphyrinogen III oxidase-like Fe-S oxidoreductase
MNIFLDMQGTVFGNWYGDHENSNLPGSTKENLLHQFQTNIKPTLPSEYEAAFMYKYASYYLRSKGYEHYEISSYAYNNHQPATTIENNNTRMQQHHDSHLNRTINRNRSTHNQIYWALDGKWYAFGLGATSYIHGRIEARPRQLVDYQKWVDDKSKDESHSNLHQNKTGRNSVKMGPPDLDRMMEIVLKRLRTIEGLSLKGIQDLFVHDDDLGTAYIEAIRKGSQTGIEHNLIVYDEQNDRLYLTEPDGFLLSNSIISNIFMYMEDIYRSCSVLEKRNS